MKQMTVVLGAVVVLMLGQAALAADPIKDDPQLSADQKKQLGKLLATLAARPNNPNAAQEHVAAVQAQMQKLFAVNNAPTAQATNAMTVTLVQGLDNGTISAGQSVLLAKELSKVFALPKITPASTNQFVKTIEPLVQQTGLEATVKLRLYADALRVIKSAPTYDPR
jgi:N-acyl-D-aspartate/D-glutamate deacylase